MEAVLVVDKPVGPTSFDVVRQVKKLVPREKVGHAGSLDPFATGALVLLVGKATKLSQNLLDADKRYEALVMLGEERDTMDRTGEILESRPVGNLTEAQVREVLASFEGTWQQTPPMYSAKKIKGVRFYDLARQNIKIRREPIPVEIYSIELLEFSSPTIRLRVHCSKGTYIRVLADEIGKRLGTYGYLEELRRLSCGPFRIEDGVGLEELVEKPEPWFEQGFDNYVRLLRTESRRRPSQPPREGLQNTARGGNSLLN